MGGGLECVIFIPRGKEVFVKSVQAISTYEMACFLFPKSLCDDFEKIMGRFWWQKGVGK